MPGWFRKKDNELDRDELLKSILQDLDFFSKPTLGYAPEKLTEEQRQKDVIKRDVCLSLYDYFIKAYGRNIKFCNCSCGRQ